MEVWLESWFESQSNWSHSILAQTWRCSTLGHRDCALPLLPGEGATLHRDHVKGGQGSGVKKKKEKVLFKVNLSDI